MTYMHSYYQQLVLASYIYGSYSSMSATVGGGGEAK